MQEIKQIPFISKDYNFLLEVLKYKNPVKAKKKVDKMIKFIEKNLPEEVEANRHLNECLQGVCEIKFLLLLSQALGKMTKPYSLGNLSYYIEDKNLNINLEPIASLIRLYDKQTNNQGNGVVFIRTIMRSIQELLVDCLNSNNVNKYLSAVKTWQDWSYFFNSISA